ncbi:hypothetical protein IV203_010447 [Nitzschia inconspicua]|uniref:Uncharacterized protein n=1 Tax=Nitzschia inconspicua TaxID=303405 RepID=A0A9K3PKG8_9STRA|nr:hypothetical protein IV203_010447 [Nitzschia inconspicua]
MPHLPSSLTLVCVPYDSAYAPFRGDKYGIASLLALVEMASNFRYHLVMTNKRCAFFVPKQVVSKTLACDRSAAREVSNKATVISAGMQWLAERRKHLEENDQEYEAKSAHFKKQATAAWQQRKVTNIDSLKRRTPNAGVKEDSPREKAKDPPDSQ